MTDDPIRMNPLNPVNAGKPVSGGKPQHDVQETYDTSFAETFSRQLRFSNHAQKRLDSRNISLSDDGLMRLSEAVEKAQKRGGKESLVLVDDLAFIVNVQERLVVTAIDRNRSGDGVFTQIDSVVIADKSPEKKVETDKPTNDHNQSS